MDEEYSPRRLPLSSRETGFLPDRQSSNYSRSSSRTTAPRRGLTNVTVSDKRREEYNARVSQRGHEYYNVQAQENARMHLGDTYTAETMSFYQLTHPTGTEEDNEQIDLLKALAFEHMDTRLATIGAAQGDTCRWLLHTEQYRGWRRGFRRSRRRFLWIKGKPGAGKSTMMRVVFHQSATDFPASINAAFFFNARGHDDAKNTQGMYRSLLHQIFSQLEQLPPGIPPRVAISMRQQGWPKSFLQNMLRAAILHLGHDKSLVCFIDALDECAEDDIRDAIAHFEELSSLALAHGIKFLVCFASRHYPTITIQHHREIDLDTQAGHEQDISDYVSSTLHLPGSLGAEIHYALLARCSGVFLWIVLTVKNLNKMYDRGGTRSQLRTHVRDTPNRIQDLFRDIMRGQDEYLLPTLTCVLFANRTLSVPQLYFAVKASTGRLSTGIWDDTEIDVPRMKKFLLASSKGLIEFWGERKGALCWAQLIHESLREYLLDDGLVGLDPSMGSGVTSISHARLAAWCVEYIAADTERYMEGFFDNSNSNEGLRDRLPLFEYVVRNTANHIAIALAGNALPDSTLERFTNMWLICRLDALDWEEARLDCAALLYYSLVRHSDTYGKYMPSRASTPLIEPTVTKETSRDQKRYKIDGRWLTFRAAAQAGSIDISRLFSNRQEDSHFHSVVEIALFRAAADGQEHVLELLLHYLHPGEEWELCHALLWVAATNLREGTTRLILEYGALPNARSAHTRSILRDVARHDNPAQYEGNPARARISIATMLLDHGAGTKGALLSAGKARRLGLMQLLTARGATFSRSELRTARLKGRHEILEMVHEAGAVIGDSASESAYTSESADSNAAVRGD